MARNGWYFSTTSNHMSHLEHCAEYLWPDGCFCTEEDLEEYLVDKSDDYQKITVSEGSAEYALYGDVL